MFVLLFDQLFDCFVSLMVLEMTLSIQSSEYENTPREVNAIYPQTKPIIPFESTSRCDARNKQINKHKAASQRASPVVMEGISPDGCIRCIYHESCYCKKKKKADNDTLTILTSDTISMLAMSIFIPTPTGGPGGKDRKNVKSCRMKALKVQSGNIWRHAWKSGKGVQMPQLSVGWWLTVLISDGI